MNLETKIIIYKFTPQVFTLTRTGMNRKLLYRKIKQLTGVTPVSLIRRVRMIRAATLLLQGRFTVSEVMYMVGYSNPSYFSRCFMAEYNISPSQYAIIQKKTGGASE